MVRLVAMILLAIVGGCNYSNNGERIGTTDYYLQNNDQSHVYLLYLINGQNRVVVDQMVVDYRLEKNYIFLLQKVARSYECGARAGTRFIETEYTDNYAYWIIDSVNYRVLGPLNREIYLEKAKAVIGSVPALSDNNTYSSFKNAVDVDLKNCVLLH